MELLAQVDSLSGGAGWVGAGLLGLVLGWLLLVHLPSKDKQHKDLIDSFLSRLSERDGAEKVRLDAQREEARVALKTVLDHCERESDRSREVAARYIERFSDAMDRGLSLFEAWLSRS